MNVPCTYGGIDVTLVECVPRANYTFRTFTVMKVRVSFQFLVSRLFVFFYLQFLVIISLHLSPSLLFSPLSFSMFIHLSPSPTPLHVFLSLALSLSLFLYLYLHVPFFPSYSSTSLSLSSSSPPPGRHIKRPQRSKAVPLHRLA